MGRTFVTFEEAATRLGCSKRSIHSYVKKGLIRKKSENGAVVLYWEDVEQLAVDKGVDAPAMNRKNFITMMSRLQKLEQDMTVVRRMMEIRDDPLRPVVGMAAGLYQAASSSLASKTWQPEEVNLWASQFERFDEVTLDAIRDATQDPNCWQVFYKLCLAQMDFAWAQYSASPDLNWRTLHLRLDEGRKKLRAVALIWIELGRGQLTPSILKEVNSPKEDLLQRLESPKKGGSGS
jgi:DNA-binding transcriptional MerR regulator